MTSVEGAGSSARAGGGVPVSQKDALAIRADIHKGRAAGIGVQVAGAAAATAVAVAKFGFLASLVGGVIAATGVGAPLGVAIAAVGVTALLVVGVIFLIGGGALALIPKKPGTNEAMVQEAYWKSNPIMLAWRQLFPPEGEKLDRIAGHGASNVVASRKEQPLFGVYERESLMIGEPSVSDGRDVRDSEFSDWGEESVVEGQEGSVRGSVARSMSSESEGEDEGMRIYISPPSTEKKQK